MILLIFIAVIAFGGDDKPECPEDSQKKAQTVLADWDNLDQGKRAAVMLSIKNDSCGFENYSTQMFSMSRSLVKQAAKYPNTIEWGSYNLIHEGDSLKTFGQFTSENKLSQKVKGSYSLTFGMNQQGLVLGSYYVQ